MDLSHEETPFTLLGFPTRAQKCYSNFCHTDILISSNAPHTHTKKKKIAKSACYSWAPLSFFFQRMGNFSHHKIATWIVGFIWIQTILLAVNASFTQSHQAVWKYRPISRGRRFRAFSLLSGVFWNFSRQGAFRENFPTNPFVLKILPIVCCRSAWGYCKNMEFDSK